MATLLATWVVAACGNEPGYHVVNRTLAPVALGSSTPVGPCSERFVSMTEAMDVDRQPAPGVWQPLLDWSNTEGMPPTRWMILTEAGTSIVFDAPAQVQPCAGLPVGWLP